MNISTIIDELQEFTSECNNMNKNLYRTMQLELEDGNIGIMFNKMIDTEEYECYLYIKRKEKIACPLLYRNFYNIYETIKYYNKLCDLIKNKSISYIVRYIKLQDIV